MKYFNVKIANLIMSIEIQLVLKGFLFSLVKFCVFLYI